MTATSITIIVIVTSILACNGQLPGDESCETLPSEIHLIKGIVNKDKIQSLYNLYYMFNCRGI